MGGWRGISSKARKGDAMNALLCDAGYNLRKILRRLTLLCAQILEYLKHKQSLDSQKLSRAIC
jgi:IS5 family transposase